MTMDTLGQTVDGGPIPAGGFPSLTLEQEIDRGLDEELALLQELMQEPVRTAQPDGGGDGPVSAPPGNGGPWTDAQLDAIRQAARADEVGFNVDQVEALIARLDQQITDGHGFTRTVAGSGWSMRDGNQAAQGTYTPIAHGPDGPNEASFGMGRVVAERAVGGLPIPMEPAMPTRRPSITAEDRTDDGLQIPSF